ncbi:hypothetical protein SVIOM74S_06355 [Streptomyces violarus]
MRRTTGYASGCTLEASSGSSPPRIRRKPAHCSYAFGPSRVTFFSSPRDLNGPLASRCATMFSASPEVMPETRASRGADAVLTSTPTPFTQSSTTASSERDSFTSDRSCWYWPTPIDFGSIFTSSASGSWSRRAIDTAPRSDTSMSGSSCEAKADAEYTDAPASDTITFVRFSSGCLAISSPASLSVSRDAVPLPMAISSTACSFASRASLAMASSHRLAGTWGWMTSVATTLPVASTTATFTPVRKPGSRPSVARVPAGAASSRSRRLAAKTRTASSSAAVRSRSRRSMPRWTRMRVRQAQRTVSSSHLSPGPAPVGDPEPVRDHPLVRRRAVRRLLGLQDEVEDLLLLAAQHRQDAVRGQLGERLREVEVVGELRARLLLALPHLGGQPSAHPHALAHLADQVGVLREPLGEDRPGAVEGRLRIGNALVGVDERGGRGEGLDGRITEQPLRQRLETGLTRDLRLGAPLGLVREVDVLQARLGLRAPDPRLKFLGELALLAHRVQDRRPPLLQLPQIAQPLLDRAQLRIVEHLGRFLAVAGDEGHRRTAVQQFHGSPDLPLPYAELLGDPAFDGPYFEGPGCRHDPVPPIH